MGTIPAQTLGDVPGMRAFLLASVALIGTGVPPEDRHRRLVLVSQGEASNDSFEGQFDLYQPAGGGKNVKVRIFTFPRLN